MHKKQKEETEEAISQAHISPEMVSKLKNLIFKFGVTNDAYIKFLISVHAMKDEKTVLQFPNTDIRRLS